MRGALIVLDELTAEARHEEGLREHEFTPAGVERAVRLVTGGRPGPGGLVLGGDAGLAARLRAKAELAELRSRGK